MKMKIILVSSLLFLFSNTYGFNLNKLFEKINIEVLKFNQIAADLAWESSLHPGNPSLPLKAAHYQKTWIQWQHNTCSKLSTLTNSHLLNETQRRQTYLLCRGPTYSYVEARETSKIYEQLQSIYNDAEICIPTDNDNNINKTDLPEVESAILNYLKAVKKYSKLENSDSILLAADIDVTDLVSIKNKTTDVLCLNGEEDFEKMMEFSRNEIVEKWVWLVWRNIVGPPMKEPYRRLVDVANNAAVRNGYSDIGAAWRDELEIPDLRHECHNLLHEVRPLYTMLHGVVRFYLRKVYGKHVPEKGAIPAHLLGSLWSHNWEPLIDLIVPKMKNIDINQSIKKLNWTVTHMIKRGEDFYLSLGLPPMPESFWEKSVFAKSEQDTRCHGTAADMFKDDDVRLLYCANTSVEDFYVIHHELGHIHYYLAYGHQPALFRQANSALHETIGDTIMLGVMTPQHLHRLGLVNDTVLFTTEKRQDQTLGDDGDEEVDIENITPDLVLLLKQALNKLPHIPFALLIDEYRWKYFENQIHQKETEKVFWAMARRLQGIVPLEIRDEKFDVGAKFHVPDNTPYIRYYLSSFLQYQLFESLCKAAVYGHRGVTEDLPITITMNRCDIYGSRAAGKLLKDLMSPGNSQHWRDILQATTGQTKILAEPLKRYYRPLFKFLTKLIQKYDIPIGW